MYRLCMCIMVTDNNWLICSSSDPAWWSLTFCPPYIFYVFMFTLYICMSANIIIFQRWLRAHTTNVIVACLVRYTWYRMWHYNAKYEKCKLCLFSENELNFAMLVWSRMVCSKLHMLAGGLLRWRHTTHASLAPTNKKKHIDYYDVVCWYYWIA